MTFEIEVNGRTRRVSVERAGTEPGQFLVGVDGTTKVVDARRVGEFGISLLFPGDAHAGTAIDLAPGSAPGEVLAHLAGRTIRIVVNGRRAARRGADTSGTAHGEQKVTAPMPGRVVRVLAAAYPHVEWYGCDPNAAAIAWASENLAGIDFILNDHAPPLPLPDHSLDLAYAISVWSHFAPSLGLRWFEEMHRLIRPGGHLVCTMHGLASIGFYAANGLRTPQQLQDVPGALYTQGWWYTREFGEEGDWGVINPDWGTAFVSPEWVLTQLCPRWRVLEFASGRNQGNQDVYVLQPIRVDRASA